MNPYNPNFWAKMNPKMTYSVLNWPRNLENSSDCMSMNISLIYKTCISCDNWTSNLFRGCFSNLIRVKLENVKKSSRPEIDRRKKTSNFRVYKWFMQNWFSYFFFSEDEEILITSTSLNTEKLKREMIPWERQKEAELEGKKLY